LLGPQHGSFLADSQCQFHQLAFNTLQHWRALHQNNLNIPVLTLRQEDQTLESLGLKPVAVKGTHGLYRSVHDPAQQLLELWARHQV
jgi:hypothetical protein